MHKPDASHAVDQTGPHCNISPACAPSPAPLPDNCLALLQRQTQLLPEANCTRCSPMRDGSLPGLASHFHTEHSPAGAPSTPYHLATAHGGLCCCVPVMLQGDLEASGSPGACRRPIPTVQQAPGQSALLSPARCHMNLPLSCLHNSSTSPLLPPAGGPPTLWCMATLRLMPQTTG